MYHMTLEWIALILGICLSVIGGLIGAVAWFVRRWMNSFTETASKLSDAIVKLDATIATYNLAFHTFQEETKGELRAVKETAIRADKASTLNAEDMVEIKADLTKIKFLHGLNHNQDI